MMIAEMHDALIKMYTLFDVTLGKFCTQKECAKVFVDLSNVFLIYDEDALCDIYRAMNSPYIHGAMDTESYNFLCRAISYNPTVVSETEKAVCLKKKTAISIKERFFSDPEPTTLGEALSALYLAADSGSTYCMALLAYFQATGTFTRRNVKSATKLTKDLALWNNLAGIMIGLSFIENDDELAMFYPPLQAALSKNMQIDAAQFISDNFDEKYAGKSTSLALALEKAFDLNIEKRDEINPVKLKLIGAVAFDDDAKRKILTSSMKSGEIESLPIDIHGKSRISIDVTTLTDLLKKRNVPGYEKVINNLMLFDEPKVSYRPMLIVCRDVVRLKNIEYALKAAISKNKMSVLDFRNLSNCVFSRSTDNIIISTLERTRDIGSVIFMKNVDEIPKDRAEDFAVMLRKENLENYKLNSPNVTLNISGFLPILFATTRPCSLIYEACDVIEMVKLSLDERTSYLDYLTDHIAKYFSLKTPLILSEGARHTLIGLEPDEMYDILYRCCKINVAQGNDASITEDLIDALTSNDSSSENTFWRR